MKSKEEAIKDQAVKYPSIFNDVIGPVMRGPSASHCAASNRLGRMGRDLMEGNITEIQIEYDTNGSLAHTHQTHGSDIGLFAGLLGWDITDERLVESSKAIQDAGIKVNIQISNFNALHPNTYKLTIKNSEECYKIIAVSTGGGMIEIIELDGVKVSISGDYFETIIYIDSNSKDVIDYLKIKTNVNDILLLHGKDQRIIEIKAQEFFKHKIINDLYREFGISKIKKISPVLPVLSRKDMTVPFLTCEDMLIYNQDKNYELWELAIAYESARGNLTKDQVFQKMKNIVDIMRHSISTGIKGTQYSDRILDSQSGLFLEQLNNKKLLDSGMLNQMILYISSTMEVKSSMGIIVAAPTAGSCGALPGACIGAADALGLSIDDITKAMLAAGMIGIFIAAFSTFAAEVCGCQAECGAGSGMAAAALVTLAGGNINQAINAASMALQNTLGMICDPVANRVEVPCLGKNVLAASNALACANMALANFDPVIPLDEVISTMDEVGKSLPRKLRCTALGGLSITKTSKELEKQLNSLKRNIK